ncbi:hypothetical protein M407DRAFT_235859 [Tulasnella calospora MUT 4182]|uniref:Uncharacterized protein n=1 Tax=Tulasnella calospora MUT 4182 TaxID=1051891 RepID=A0A0C3Q8F2_9AGAM|nr:hypothetical protein M407DRAFT_235859 [Tulasnella calospora MUT 4182]
MIVCYLIADWSGAVGGLGWVPGFSSGDFRVSALSLRLPSPRDPREPLISTVTVALILLAIPSPSIAMHFISRVLLSWTLFLFLVVQGLDDDNVIKTLLPFLPLILCAVASTYLVHDTILSRLPPHATSEIISSTSVDWAKPSPLVNSAAPITTLTTQGVIDRPEVSIWRGLFTGYALLAFMAVAISITLIARRSIRHTVTLNHPVLPPSQVEPAIRRPPTFSTAQRYGAARLGPKAQTTDFACPSYLPYGVLSKGPENETTAAALSQTLPDHTPVLAPPPAVDNDLHKSIESDQSFDETLPLLGWNFTTSSTFQEEDGDDVDHDVHDDDDEIWLDPEDDEQIQIKEVARGIVPFPSHVEDEAEAGEEVPPAPPVPARVQELIPTRGINPSIELRQPRATQEAIAFPSREDEKHQGPAPPTSTPAPTGAPRVRLGVPAAKPSPKIQSLKARPAQEGIPFPLRKDEDDEDQGVQQRRPSSARSPSRPRPRIPTGWRNPNTEVKQGLKPLPACVEEEEEEEDSSDQDRNPSSTSKPNRDASTSTTSTAVGTPTVAEVQNACEKRSAMKKKRNSKKKTATVSFVHFTEVRDVPKTICDVNARAGRFVSMQDEEGLEREYRLLKNLLGPEDEEVEENRWIPLESEEPELQPSLLSWNTVPQDGAGPLQDNAGPLQDDAAPEAPETINRSARLRKMFHKLSPLRFGKRLFKKKTGPL